MNVANSLETILNKCGNDRAIVLNSMDRDVDCLQDEVWLAEG